MTTRKLSISKMDMYINFTFYKFSFYTYYFNIYCFIGGLPNNPWHCKCSKKSNLDINSSILGLMELWRNLCSNWIYCIWISIFYQIFVSLDSCKYVHGIILSFIVCCKISRIVQIKVMQDVFDHVRNAIPFAIALS